MERMTLTPFGRQPVSAGLLARQSRLAATPSLPAVDKWAVFNDLRAARSRLGLSDRDLSVLHALLSFLPGKEMADTGALLVYPSNAALCDRAHGMAESTLRRHLAALVRVGVILRHDSPNGKRYAARDASGTVVEAYGFDLRPLLANAAYYAALAADLAQVERDLRRRRTHLVLRLRDVSKLLDYAAELGLATESLAQRRAALSRALRRKMEGEHLDACLDAAADLLAACHALVSPESKEMSGNDAVFERHYSESKTDSSDFELCLEKSRAQGVSGELEADPVNSRSTEANRAPPPIPLVVALKACPDLALYSPDPIRTWRDLVNTAHALRPMIGISSSAWDEAVHFMGPEVAALALAGILQRLSGIRNPGGYLRALSSQAAEGRFSPGPMLMALLNTAGQRPA
jgi:replication initiation protein RepC